MDNAQKIKLIVDDTNERRDRKATKVKVHIKSALKTKTNNKHEKRGPEESFYAYASHSMAARGDSITEILFGADRAGR